MILKSDLNDETGNYSPKQIVETFLSYFLEPPPEVAVYFKKLFLGTGEDSSSQVRKLYSG